jgi:hypothetical protein
LGINNNQAVNKSTLFQLLALLFASEDINSVIRNGTKARKRFQSRKRKVKCPVKITLTIARIQLNRHESASQ